MKLDINLVWQQASAAVAANREVLLALAGVFILLPRLAFELFAPPAPATNTGMDLDAMAQVMQGYYISVAPWLLAVTLVETVGTLALLTLFTDRSHPTVGQAIRRGAVCVAPYLLAQFMLVLALGLVGGLVLGVATMTGSKQFAGVVLGTILFWAMYAIVRLIVLAPAIVVDRARGPLAAIGRSWKLTRGTAARMFGLIAMFVVVGMVAMMAVSGVIGSLGALVAGPKVARLTVVVVASVLSSTFTVYLMATIAAIHRQLAAPPAGPANSLY